MKKIILAAAVAISALGAASAASAAPNAYGDHRSQNQAAYNYHGQSINATQRDIERRIDQGVRNHDLSAREARALRGELRQIASLEARYRHNGLTRWERSDLDRRLDVLSRKVQFERHDRDHRGDGHADRRGS